jgi:hypothetical protein
MLDAAAAGDPSQVFDAAGGSAQPARRLIMAVCCAFSVPRELESRMPFRISWDLDPHSVTIVTATAEDALLLSAEHAAKGQAPTVFTMDGAPLTPFDLELMAAATASRPHRPAAPAN